MQKIKVSNMLSPSGKAIPTQTNIKTADGVYFQSYSTLIAFENNNGDVFLDKKKWDCSVTTGRYRNIFLGESKKETQAKIKSGEYTLMDLN